jgi:hypothetical protein
MRSMGGFTDEDEAAVANEGEQWIEILAVPRQWMRYPAQLVAKAPISR